jgi:hypothetical protein
MIIGAPVWHTFFRFCQSTVVHSDTMIIARPCGTPWVLENAEAKLLLRAELPGARVFDLAADALRQARQLGLGEEPRLTLALSASWLVNSPAISRVLKRWALPGDRETWLTLLNLLHIRVGPLLDPHMLPLLDALGTEPYLVEAVSKVAALLEPDGVPLMPAPARTFILGNDATGTESFVNMVHWFAEATAKHRAELTTIANAHTPVKLSAAQVLDRMLWFDSEGHRHFPP